MPLALIVTADFKNEQSQNRWWYQSRVKNGPSSSALVADEIAAGLGQVGP
jgi:hypothetical protein